MRTRLDLQFAFALVVIALFLVAGVFGSWIAPYDPAQQDLTRRSSRLPGTPTAAWLTCWAPRRWVRTC